MYPRSTIVCGAHRAICSSPAHVSHAVPTARRGRGSNASRHKRGASVAGSTGWETLNDGKLFHATHCDILLAELCGLCGLAHAAPSAPGVGQLVVTLQERSETGLHTLNCPAVLIAPDVALLDAGCLDPLLENNPLKPGEPAQFGKYKATFTLSEAPDFVAGVTSFKVHPRYQATRCEAYMPGQPDACNHAAKWCREVFATQARPRMACLSSRDLYARTFMHSPVTNQALAYLDDVADAVHVAPLARQDEALLKVGARVERSPPSAMAASRSCPSILWSAAPSMTMSHS